MSDDKSINHFEGKELKFAVDCMLGKLAKLLRIMGFDTFYQNYISDAELVDIAYEEERIILTRDVGLTKRKKAKNYLLVNDIDPKKQIEQVKNELNLDKMRKPFTRCLICNSILKSIDKNLVIDKVPEYTFKTINEFYICPDCGKIFWAATHIESIKKQYNIE